MVTRPVAGLKLTIGYDPEKIGYEYQSFQTMGMLRNVVFRFYNKELLETIKKKELVQYYGLLKQKKNDYH